jgi:hypothetical protein
MLAQHGQSCHENGCVSIDTLTFIQGEIVPFYSCVVTSHLEFEFSPLSAFEFPHELSIYYCTNLTLRSLL